MTRIKNDKDDDNSDDGNDDDVDDSEGDTARERKEVNDGDEEPP